MHNKIIQILETRVIYTQYCRQDKETKNKNLTFKVHHYCKEAALDILTIKVWTYYLICSLYKFKLIKLGVVSCYIVTFKINSG